MSTPVEVIVVGGGIAGMAYATQLVDLAGKRVVHIRILTKAIVQVSNSYAAQGGVAAVIHSDDSYAQHVQDTISVGAGRNDAAVVRSVVREGPGIIRRLIGLGARFDADSDGQLELAREGGHSQARVVHHRDSTGAEIVRVLKDRMRSEPAIEVVEDQRAIDLLTEGHDGDRRCIGVRSMDLRAGAIMDHFADVVVLATGGAGQVYKHTTNPLGATGDGVAMAVRAGVALRDMAFVQFHPTALYTGTLGPSFLISEAVRGAGARLLNLENEPLMRDLHPMGDLAPRNIVARAIHRDMKRTGGAHVWLDAGPVGCVRFAREFPAIDEQCREHGIVPCRDLIPVMPSAHYMCGGIRTDDLGRTDLPGLYALGECASSGLHGADRLASNSLLEALVLPKHAACSTLREGMVRTVRPVVHGMPGKMTVRKSRVMERCIEALKEVMSAQVGIVRDRDGLVHALHRIAGLERALRRAMTRPRWSRELLDLRDMLAVARGITEAALNEPRSIGAHYVEERKGAVMDN